MQNSYVSAAYKLLSLCRVRLQPSNVFSYDFVAAYRDVRVSVESRPYLHRRSPISADCIEHTVLVYNLILPSRSREMPHLSWNSKVHYPVHKRPLPVPVLNHLQPYFHKTCFNIILPSMPRSSDWSISFTLSNQIVVRISHLSHACYMPRPFVLDFISNNIWWRVRTMELLAVQFSSAFCLFILLRSRYSPK
jgi:hypothetical protein